MERTSHELDIAKRTRNRLVTLDRIAHSYENAGHVETAEKYFKSAIALYDKSRGQRELSKGSERDAADLMALDLEIPGVLFNYSQLLMSLQRLDEAESVLKRALTFAHISSLSGENLELIRSALVSVSSAKSADKVKKL